MMDQLSLPGTLLAQGNSDGIAVCITIVVIIAIVVVAVVVGMIVLAITSVVALVGGTVALFSGSTKEKEDPLLQYIRRAKSSGLPSDFINQRCRASGWTDDEIKDAWDDYHDNG